MESETAADNDATIARLGLRPTDAVLEIGFGPGRALDRVAAIVTAGHVAGVDASADMVATATRRCRHPVERGRMDLRLGVVEDLPFADDAFDAAYSVHTLYFWERPARAVDELRRVLKHAGRLVLCFRRRDDDATADFPSSVYRFNTGDEVAELLRAGGFEQIAVDEPAARGLLIATARRR